MSSPLAPQPNATAETEVDALRRQLREANERIVELENETVRRGVKLSCSRIALSRAKIAFDETTRQRQEMAQDVAHDLRTPLASIKGAAQNMLDGVAGPLGADAREYVEIVRDHADRLISAVNWLLEAMRATSKPIEIEPSEIDLHELCASVVHGLRPIALERGLTLARDGEPAPAKGDGEKIRQVLENLIGNGLKFTERGGTVSVRTDVDADSVRIYVRDSGVGISSEDQGRIFERYYRRDRFTVRGDGSSGLGLVISRDVVRMHGGEICVRSTIGDGSEFTVRLPRDAGELGPWSPGCE